MDFAGLARAAGYRNVYDFRDVETLRAKLPEVFATPGPTFATLHVRPGLKPHLDYALVHGEAARKRFEAGLADELSRQKASA